ncbi:hypothetical protein UFOVP1116_21 [uncultured Caudovirales phage]|uniref:Uncharacterized protein n=1 Tax=uncultured Caudovirales phage TaxID=2100421 RepID=A0A6J7XGK3_9CAUD|nr:hypothetical protein UFOVP1116_21 [uncultured Caudovirales phage]CAB4204195.1 hypothetical protein UFOVP1391_41 [uncultured Caudovirales phage]CAB4215462.1 hypothetical protein UFOVP1480_18 [uncultured Caudovirales phage]CAB5230071.1 hypothetical protein UFOVP1568_34 [uncultured Caudovirales phage]
MADEINISLNVDVSSGNYRASFRPGNIQPDMATIIGSDIAQNVAASWTLLTVGASVVPGGYYWFRNLSTSTSATWDPSIKISIGGTSAAATSTPFLNLRPGEYALGRCVTTTFSAISSTATANLQFGIMSL